jgi:hypothetical protein
MDMGVAVVVPMRMPVVMRMAIGVVMGMVVMTGVGRGGNHAQDVIL